MNHSPETNEPTNTTKTGQRSGLIVSKKCIFGIIALVSVAIVLAAVISAILYRRVVEKPPKKKNVLFSRQPVKTCDSPQCKIASEYFLESMNQSVDPCNNFFKFVCGSAKKSNNRALDIAQKLTITNLATALLNRTTLQDNNAVKQAKEFFQKCISYNGHLTMDNERLGLKSVIEHFGGFPMYNENYDSNVAWFKRLAAVVRQFGIFENGFIQSIILNFTVNDRFELVISKPMSYYNDVAKNGNESLYRILIEESVCNLLKSSCDEEEKESVQDQITSVVSFQRIVTEYLRADDGSNEVMRMRDFEAKFPHINAHEFLSEVFVNTGHKFNKNTMIRVQDLEFWKNMDQLIHNTKPETLANVIGWSNFEIIQYTTSPKIFLNTYKYLAQNKKRQLACKDKCFMWTDISYKFAVARLVAENIDNEDLKERVYDTANSFKDAFTQLIQEQTWMTEDTKRKSFGKITMMQLDIAYPNWIKNDVALTKYYASNENFTGASFIKILRKALSFNANEKLLQIRKAFFNEDEDLQELSLVVPLSEARYDPLKNSLTLPLRHCFPPLFWSNATSVLTFASAFLTIGKALLQSVSGHGSMYDVYGNRRNWWDYDTSSNFNQTIACMRESQNIPADESSLLDDVANSGALRVAFKAFLQSGFKDDRLVDLEIYDDKRLFFIGAGKALCNFYASKGVMERNDETDVKLKYTRSLNVKEFAQSYKCLAGSRMNKKPKCFVW